MAVVEKSSAIEQCSRVFASELCEQAVHCALLGYDWVVGGFGVVPLAVERVEVTAPGW